MSVSSVSFFSFIYFLSPLLTLYVGVYIYIYITSIHLFRKSTATMSCFPFTSLRSIHTLTTLQSSMPVFSLQTCSCSLLVKKMNLLSVDDQSLPTSWSQYHRLWLPPQLQSDAASVWSFMVLSYLSFFIYFITYFSLPISSYTLPHWFSPSFTFYILSSLSWPCKTFMSFQTHSYHPPLPSFVAFTSWPLSTLPSYLFLSIPLELYYFVMLDFPIRP